MRFGHRFESRYYQRSTLNDGLIVAWPLNEASGARYPDYGGTEFNLTDVNTVGTADAPAGIGGLCANFDGSTEYLYCADPFSPPSALSVSAWAYNTALSGVDTIAAQWRNPASADRSWALYANGSTLEVALSADGTTPVTATSGTLSANTWYLTTLVWSGSSLVVYRNLTPGTPAVFAGPIRNNTEELRIGALNAGGSPGSFWAGRIAQPLIWNRALTLAEITFLYNNGNGRPLSDWLA